MATQSQIKTYQAVADIFLKVIIALVIITCFAVGFGYLIYILVNNDAPLENKLILGSIESAFGISLPQILKHFFPNKENTN